MFARLKPCPFCKEKIRREAVKCLFCGEWLDDSNTKETLTGSQTVGPLATAPTAESSATEGRQINISSEDDLRHADSLSQPLESSGTIEQSSSSMKSVARALDERLAPPVQRTVTEFAPAVDGPSTANLPRDDAASSMVRPSKLNWITAGLFIVGCVMSVVIVLDRNWTNAKVQSLTESLTRVFLQILFLAGVIAFAFGRKHFKALLFSAVFAVSTAIFAYSAHFWKSKNIQVNAQFAEAARKFSKAGMKYLEGGSSSTPPRLVATGDEANDEIGRYMTNFLGAFGPVIANMNKELDALDPKDVFDHSVLGERKNLFLEADKRVQQERILETSRTELLQAIEAFREKVLAASTSKHAQEISDGINRSIRGSLPQFERMFDLLKAKEKTEIDFLKFMASSFDNYTLKDKIIFFRTVTDRTRYNELAKNVEESTKNLAAFREERMKEINSNIQKLSK